MILMTLLTIIGILLLIAAVAVLAVGGTAFVVVFADLIVCVAFIVLVIKFLVKRRRK